MKKVEKKTKQDSLYLERQELIKSLDGTEAGRVLKYLGTSPVRLTKKKIDDIKSLFPVPREQSVLWCDAEFDLRPSGIVCTEKGVFIKTDEPVLNKFKKKEKKARASALYYYQWSDFEPAGFIGENKKDNKLLEVSEKCRAIFLEMCKIEADKQKEQVKLTIESGDQSINLEAPILAAAAVESAGEAVFVEQKAFINTPVGHGEMAEEANNILDKLHGSDAAVVGRDNAKNGPDRIVDGIQIQTKYYKTATGSVEACFLPQNGEYRYMHNGEPMKLEVPKDQYEKALSLFEHKIKEGKVPGVTDPEMAKDIVKQGRLTYKQAVSLTKSGTIESLLYDAATGAIICTSVFGISFVVTVFLAWRKTGDIKKAVEAGFATGVQMFGLSFVQHILVSQISRTSFANSLIGPSQQIVGMLGYENSALIVNGIRALAGKSSIYGAAASKHLAKIMRNNALTSTIAFAVFSAKDTYKLVAKKASASQYFKNIATLAGGIAAGSGGAVAAGVAAGKIAAAMGTVVSPGVGTVIGIAGGFVGGTLGSLAIGTVGDIAYEGDMVRLSRLLNAYISLLSVEYLLSEEEIELLIKVIGEIPSKELKKLIEGLQGVKMQERYLRKHLEPKFEEIVIQREKFAMPNEDEFLDVLAEII